MSKHFFSIIFMTAVFVAVFSSCRKDDTLFSVTFDSKGGTPITAQIVKKGGKVEKPEAPTLISNYFAGWAMEDNEASLLWDFVNGTVTADLTLYAKWVQDIYTVTVTSDDNGTASANVTSAVMGELIRLEATANNGYRFAGWQVIEGGINLSNTTDNPVAFIMPYEAVEVKAIFLPYQGAPIKMWQTYGATPNGVHEWYDIDFEYTVTRLPDLPMRTGYAFTDGNNLFFFNRANGNLFQYKNNYTTYERVYFSLLRFQSGMHEFFNRDGYVYACSLFDETNYKTIQIAEGSFVYVYAQYNNDVIAITNYGEPIVFRNNEWYRMTMVDDDVYKISPDADMLTGHSGKQFYSSIIYQGKTLLGEFPSGRIYEFFGDVLKVSDMSPPEELLFISPEFIGQRKEAQSMAIYGGDLFVGYWPDGVILRYDYKQKSWSQFTRLFTFPAEGKNLFLDYTPIPSSFYGQRVTCLVPFEDALYAVTSNLNEWYDDVVPSPLLTEEQIKQYGAVYRIYRPGCKTTYFPR